MLFFCGYVSNSFINVVYSLSFAHSKYLIAIKTVHAVFFNHCYFTYCAVVCSLHSRKRLSPSYRVCCTCACLDIGKVFAGNCCTLSPIFRLTLMEKFVGLVCFWYSLLSLGVIAAEWQPCFGDGTVNMHAVHFIFTYFALACSSCMCACVRLCNRSQEWFEFDP